MLHYDKPPILLRDVIGDTRAVRALLERNGPYTPLGGWFWPGEREDVPTRAMWFQNDWVQGDLVVEGSDLFMQHSRVAAAAREFYGAEVVVPHTLYVNLMAAVEKCGPAHTDNPVFQGRSRRNTPMWLLRTMFWSGLFERWSIRQATSIWWMNDTEGGGLRYWADGPNEPPSFHSDEMANTALVGDNHGMFHQVEPVGPFGSKTPLVTGRARLEPASDGTGDWTVTDQGSVIFRAPLEAYRVSVLWKAHVYANEEERVRLEADVLSLADVSQIFAEDLARKGSSVRLNLEGLEDASQMAAFANEYPEAAPVEAGASIFDGYI